MDHNQSKSDSSRIGDWVGWAVLVVLAYWALSSIITSTGNKKEPAAEKLRDFEEKKAKAESGDRDAQESIAHQYWQGDGGVQKNYKEAVKWYRKAAEQGLASSEHMLGILYGTGEGVKQDDEEAVRWYRKAASKGNCGSQYALGGNYLYGWGLKKDKVQACAWFKVASLNGSLLGRAALDALGAGEDIERWGTITPAEFLQAETMAKEMIDKNLSLIDSLGRVEILEKLQIANPVERHQAAELEEFFRDTKALAEYGHAYAQGRFGVCYRDGKGVVQDDNEAMKWFTKAAKQGYDVAQFNLARMFGSLGEDEKSLFWYRKAAEQGRAAFQSWLGFVCSVRGTKEEEAMLREEAFKWTYKAAEQGLADDQLKIGRWYEVGLGVQRDYALALAWYSIASMNGSKDAVKHKDDLTRKLPHELLAKVVVAVSQIVKKNRYSIKSESSKNRSSKKTLTEEESLEVIEGAVREEIEKPFYQELTEADFAKIETLEIDGKQLSDVRGLKKLPNLDQLSLDGNQIDNLQEFEVFTKLTSLSLDDNKLTDASALNKLTQLSFLSLDRNQLTNVNGLEGLTQLSLLFLNGNKLENVPQLENLAELIWLGLGDNQLDDVSGLRNLVGLTQLNLIGNQLNNINGLEKLTKLLDLDLSGNRLTEVDELAGLIKLRQLNISDNPLVDAKGLEQLKSLENLSLSHTQLTNVKFVESMKGLKELWITSSKINDLKGLENLTRLEVLGLNGNQLSDVSVLMKLTNLELVYLFDNPLKLEQIDELQKALPNCKIDHNAKK